MFNKCNTAAKLVHGRLEKPAKTAVHTRNLGIFPIFAGTMVAMVGKNGTVPLAALA